MLISGPVSPLQKPLHGFIDPLGIFHKQIYDRPRDMDTGAVKINQHKHKSNPKQNPRKKSPHVIALVSRQPLRKSVNDQRKHHDSRYPEARITETDGNRNPCKDTDQLPRAARTDRELFPSKIKRAVRPCMAPEENPQKPAYLTSQQGLSLYPIPP